MGSRELHSARQHTTICTYMKSDYSFSLCRFGAASKEAEYFNPRSSWGRILAAGIAWRCCVANSSGCMGCCIVQHVAQLSPTACNLINSCNWWLQFYKECEINKKYTIFRKGVQYTVGEDNNIHDSGWYCYIELVCTGEGHTYIMSTNAPNSGQLVPKAIPFWRSLSNN